MNTNEQFSEQRALSELLAWIRSIDTSDWYDPFAVTLNFWPGTRRDIAERSLGEFLNRLNRRVFGNANLRYGKRLRVIPVFEGTDNLHCHLLIESADFISDAEFTQLCKQQWAQVRSAQTYIKCTNGPDIEIFDARPVHSAGWQGYIAKHRTKSSSYDVSIPNMVL